LNKNTEEYLHIFEKFQEEITWVLRQQEKLRLEYLIFLKKDLPEILHQRGIKRYPWNKYKYHEIVESIINDYSMKITSSIELLNTDLAIKIRGDL